ncbi:MAG: hypothetical protein U1F25_12605 [Rubrivivax sp.]
MSDESAAVRGVRAGGMVASELARISGTSAAAPAVTRRIANLLFHNRYSAGAIDVDDPEPVPADNGARATLTPKTDDRFRRARLRVRP